MLSAGRRTKTSHGPVESRCRAPLSPTRPIAWRALSTSPEEYMKTLKEVVRGIPWLIGAYRHLMGTCRASGSLWSPFLRAHPPGHFYSPIPDLKEVLRQQDRIFKKDSKECPGVDLKEGAQLELLKKLAVYYDDLPFSPKADGVRRYYYDNVQFSYEDAIFLFAMLRHFRPSRIIEVGSGFSSAVMLDTNDAFFDGSIDLTFVEPFPAGLNALLRETDRQHCTVLTEPVQDVDIQLFDALDENDILFIDSSHVVKVGSDVSRILFEILPRLRRGVIIHFHDIMWPFEYPKSFFLKGWAWNEAYLLRSFLQYNHAFEVLFAVSFMDYFHGDMIEKSMPLCSLDRVAVCG